MSRRCVEVLGEGDLISTKKEQDLKFVSVEMVEMSEYFMFQLLDGEFAREIAIESFPKRT